jgi:hypothetical protein
LAVTVLFIQRLMASVLSHRRSSVKSSSVIIPGLPTSITKSMLEANIGYGNGTCSTPQANGVNPLTRIAMIDGTRLRTVIALRDNLAVNLASY